MENDKVIAPFRMSAQEAIRRMLRSKTAAALSGPKVAIGTSSNFSCAKRCAKAKVYWTDDAIPEQL